MANTQPYFGNNGQGTSEEMNKDIQLRKTDPNYVNSQIEHANNVIKTRQSEGLDITAQLNYLNKLKQDAQAFQPQDNQGNSNTFRPDLSGTQMGNFDAQASQAQMNNSLQQNAQAQMQQQKAILDMQLKQQLASLEKAYNDAISDGKISVREAQEQFQAEKTAIEKQAYLDSERTMLYSNEMGIQNSQQMLGLMQGDNARTNELHQSARLQKEKRINDITDRLNRVKQDYTLDSGLAYNQYNSGLLNASGQINAQMYQNMFEMQRDDYTFNRQQQAQLDMANVQHQYDRNNQDYAHTLDLEKMSNAYNLDLGKMKAQTRETLQIMEVQNNYDLNKMAVAFQQDLSKMATQHGYSSALQSQSHRNSMAQIGAEASSRIAQIEAEKNQSMQWVINQYTEGTPEYWIRTKQIEEEARLKKESIWNEAQATAMVNLIDPTFDPKNKNQANYSNKLKQYNTAASYFGQPTYKETSPTQKALEKQIQIRTTNTE